MGLLGQDRREWIEEQRLLGQLCSLARRWEGCPPADALDAVLVGAGAEGPVLPSQRARSCV